MQLFFLENKKREGTMHDEHDSPNYMERKPLGPYGGPMMMMMMSGKAQIPLMGFFLWC
jgi:hypothetical protein